MLSGQTVWYLWKLKCVVKHLKTVYLSVKNVLQIANILMSTNNIIVWDAKKCLTVLSNSKNILH